MSMVQGKWGAFRKAPQRCGGQNGSLCRISRLKLEPAMPAITSLTISAAAPLGRVLSVLAGRARRALKRLAAKVKSRRDAIRLGGARRRMPGGNGLRPGEPGCRFRLPAWRDPGGLLARRVAE